MTQNKIMEMMKNTEVKESIHVAMLSFLAGQKIEKLKKFNILNQYAKKGQIIFVGSSLMEFFPINELQQNIEKCYTIYNRGIAGYISSDLLISMEKCIFELEPSKIFINIGTNDISSLDCPYKKEILISNYDNILTQIGERLPSCKVYVMAYYPINEIVHFSEAMKINIETADNTRTNVAIIEANVAVEELAKKHNYEFINVNDGLVGEDGNLKEEYTVDGIHMWPNGYLIVLENLKKYL